MRPHNTTNIYTYVVLVIILFTVVEVKYSEEQPSDLSDVPEALTLRICTSRNVTLVSYTARTSSIKEMST